MIGNELEEEEEGRLSRCFSCAVHTDRNWIGEGVYSELGREST